MSTETGLVLRLARLVALLAVLVPVGAAQGPAGRTPLEHTPVELELAGRHVFTFRAERTGYTPEQLSPHHTHLHGSLRAGREGHAPEPTGA